MTSYLIHSLHSSPCLSPSFPLLWVHLCSNFLKRASRPSHPFHLGRIHPYPALLSTSSTGAWRYLALIPQAVASSEEWGETHVLRWSWDEKEPPCGSMESLKESAQGGEGCGALTRASRSCSIYCLPSSLSFSCPWLPTFPAQTDPYFLSNCFLVIFHGNMSRNPGFTADFAAKGNFNTLYFHTPPPRDSHPS